MKTTTKQAMSNEIARKYYLHDADFNHDTGERCCYFSEHGYDAGWGFWVSPDGTVDADELATGDLPSARVVDACRRAAVRYLASR